MRALPGGATPGSTAELFQATMNGSTGSRPARHSTDAWEIADSPGDERCTCAACPTAGPAAYSTGPSNAR